MIYKIIFLVSLFSIKIWALPSDHIVKIYSARCNQDTLQKMGSGILFSYKSINYIITSEHVVYQSGAPFCHSAFNSEIGTVNLEFVSANWSNGLALMKVQSFLPFIADDIASVFSQKSVETSDKISTVGFPAGSTQTFVDSNGYVLKSKSLRHLMPELETTIESVNSHAEYGMSGGALLDKNNQVIGVLSHQKVEMLPGQGSKIKSIDSNQSTNHIISIPSPAVLNWVFEQIQNKNQISLVNWTVDSSAQLKGQEIIKGLSLKLETILQPNFNTTSGNAIISGGDGVGIGGAQVIAPKSIIISYDFTKNISVSDKKWEKLILASQKYKQITVFYFVEVNYFQNKLNRIYFENIGDFFQLIKTENIIPVISIPGDFAKINLDIVEITNKISQSIMVLRQSNSPLLEKFKLICDLIRSGQPELIPNEYLKILLTSEDEWTELFNFDFKESVEINSNLRALQEKLKNIRY